MKANEEAHVCYSRAAHETVILVLERADHGFDIVSSLFFGGGSVVMSDRVVGLRTGRLLVQFSLIDGELNGARCGLRSQVIHSSFQALRALMAFRERANIEHITNYSLALPISRSKSASKSVCRNWVRQCEC